MGSDLEIEIRPGRTTGSYEVEVDSPAGTATGTMQLDTSGILGRRRELAASVLASAVTSRSTFSTLERPVRDVGHSLFEALFTGHVYGRYTASLQQAGTKGEPLRVVLRIRDPELAGIPWEALFDAESGEYLCQREPLVRYVEAAQPSAPLSATGPLRILGMVAAPSDLPALDTAEERRRLDAALGELCEQGLVEMVWVENGNWGALQQKLMAGPWHVLHVIAHGGAGPSGGVLALENEQTGASAQVSARRFARLLHACRPVPRLVVLNSCSSGESAADDLLSSTAAALVHSGISAAVAMQFAVTDPAALAFSRGFYQALASNIAVDEAVRLGRIAIDGTSEQTLEWVTPVIYLRTDDTRLFQLNTQEARPVTQPEEPEEISSEAAKYGLYVQALAAVRKERYDEAVALLDSLITLDPAYRDATEVRNRVRQEQRLGATYERAREAESAGDLEAARRGYRNVINLDPDHRDALARHDAAERLLTIASLKDELRVHADEEDWEAVLAVSAELSSLDPEAADPEGLASRAREMTAPEQTAPEQTAPEQTAPEQTAPEQTAPEDRSEMTLPIMRTTQPGGDQPPPEETTTHTHGDHPRPQRHWKKIVAIGAPLVIVLALVGLYLLGSNEPTTTSNGSATTDTSGSGSTGTTVTCWDNSSADKASNCPLPTGFDGLKSVFPSMDDTCQKKEPSLDGKVELWECVYDNYTVRYSRWADGYDKYAYFDQNIKGATSQDWTENGVTYGRIWSGLDPRTSETRRYRAIGAYKDWPYDVTIKGVDQSGLDEGVAAVQAKAPDQIGLP